MGQVLARLVWVFAALGSLVGATELVLDWSSATGAPQQLVIVAVALGWTVLPYCFARAVTAVISGN
jgi:hypothetical protein